MQQTDRSSPSPRPDEGPRKKGIVDVWTLVLAAVFVGAMVYQVVTGC